ncbi:multidrug effflux MFS transporter [Streptomyces hebeiensis]|uniref:multidrug effflux MFS transporter n=1 Tax=Streptomyces hebeiensis TaxID=229486 RepID=UPI0031D24C3F
MRPCPRRRLVAVLVLLCFVGPLSTDMYLPAFPRMAVDLRTDASGVQATLAAFLAGMTLGHLVFGPVSDRYGRRVPLLVGAGGCAVATGVCAVAPGLDGVVAGRFLAGFGGAAGVVIGRAVVTDIAEGAVAARLLGVLMALAGLAPVLAPLAGGLVIEAVGWRGVFTVLAGAALLVAGAVLVAVPESLPPDRRHPGGGRELLRTVREVTGDRAYAGYSLAFTFAFGALFSYIAGAPFVLQRVLGLSVGASSAVFACGAVCTALTGAVGARLTARTGPERLLRTGAYAMCAGAASLLAAALAGALTLPVCLSLTALTCGGLGLVTGNATALALARVPHAAGTGSALLGTAQSALGAAVTPLVGLAGAENGGPVFGAMTACGAATLLAARWAGRADAAGR